MTEEARMFLAKAAKLLSEAETMLSVNLNEAAGRFAYLMAYRSINPKAACQPLRSIPLIRPVLCLGQVFLARHDPVALARAQAAHALRNARTEIELATSAYTAARAAIGEVNRMGRQDRHDRVLYPDRAVARRVSAAFGTTNRRRARFLAAYKTLAAADAAVLALTG